MYICYYSKQSQVVYDNVRLIPVKCTSTDVCVLKKLSWILLLYQDQTTILFYLLPFDDNLVNELLDGGFFSGSLGRTGQLF